MLGFLHQFLRAFIPVFVALDAIGTIPLFVSLTDGFDKAERRRIANQCTLAAAIIILVFMAVGKAMLNAVGIAFYDFQIAGGLLLLALSTHMLIAGRTTSLTTQDVAIFPLASPLIAGPAVLTTTLVLIGSRGWLPTLASLMANLLIAWIVFRRAHRIEMLITRQGAKGFSKVVEILLAAIAVSMIRSGIQKAILAG